MYDNCPCACEAQRRGPINLHNKHNSIFLHYRTDFFLNDLVYM